MELFFLAVRNVVRNTRRSSITFVAVLMAVAIMLCIRALLSGLQDSLRNMVVEAQTGAVQVSRTGYRSQVLGSPLSLNIPADQETLEKIRAIPHVRAAAYRIRFGGMVSNGDTTVFAMLTGLDPKEDALVCPRRKDDLDMGSLPAAPDEAVLDSELATKLAVKAGAKVVVLSPDRDDVLNGVEVTLSGTIQAGRLPGMDSKVGLLTLSQAQELLRMPALATEIAVGVDSLDNVDSVRDGISAALGPTYEAAPWYDTATFVKDATAIMDGVATVISGIFLFVALLGVANTMLMSVLERTREIGTMLAVGMRRRRVRVLFLIEAGLLAFMGATTGTTVAFLLVLNWRREGLAFRVPMGFDVHLYPRLTLTAVLVTVVVTCLGALLAALGPSWTASRMRPVAALSHV